MWLNGQCHSGSILHPLLRGQIEDYKQQVSKEVLFTLIKGISQDKSVVDLSQDKRNDIPETHICTKREVENAISRMGNSFTREDKISPKIIKKARPVISHPA